MAYVFHTIVGFSWGNVKWTLFVLILAFTHITDSSYKNQQVAFSHSCIVVVQFVLTSQSNQDARAIGGGKGTEDNCSKLI